jgi:hypothetical protein
METCSTTASMLSANTGYGVVVIKFGQKLQASKIQNLRNLNTNMIKHNEIFTNETTASVISENACCVVLVSPISCDS